MFLKNLVRNLVLTLTAFWLAVASSAQAGIYDARRSELISVLESLKLEARFETSIKRKINDYCDFRERVLQDALQIVQDPSSNNKEQAAKWRDHFSKNGSEAIKIFSTALQDAMPASAVNFITANANIEADFYVKLGTMPAGALRDRIMVYREAFDKASRSLTDKWKEVNSQDESIDSMARSAQNELRELYKSAAQAVAEANTMGEKKAIAALELALKHLPLPEKTDDLIIEFLKMIESMNTKVENYASKLRDVYSTEDRVVMVFNNTRKDVADFLKIMNLSLLNNEMNEMLIGIEQTGRKTLTSGQQADAARYYTLLSTVLKAHYDAFGKDFETFVKDFDHIFFNALGDKTIESLLEPQSWRDWSDNVRGIALEDALKRLQDNAAKNFGVDFSRVTDPADREMVQKWLLNNMAAMRDKVGQVHGVSISDRIRTVIYMSVPGSLRTKLLERMKSQ